MITEKKGLSINGYVAFFIILPALQVFFAYLLFSETNITLGVFGSLITLVLWAGFFMVQPNQGKVLTLFGSYIGTEKRTGLRWTIPVIMRKTVSLRVRNFESAKIKVNDNLGNPIEIAAIIVWSVTDTAEAIFQVDDYESYVTIQSESALRNMASSFSYDPQSDDQSDIALRSHPQQVSEILKQEVQDRLQQAGLTVHEAKISHLAYAQEIASAMLQRQQASAIIAARSQIVEGAVGMVEMALDKLSEKHVVELDEERKAVMVSNLLVVLCSDKNPQPVINSGSLY